uniref:Uncharacterized protein n=1 Tax=Megaselia scalaris TaxID=36166 RepID=T1GUL1_MEGSC
NKELEEKQHTLQQELHEKDEKVKLLQKTVDDLKTTRNIIESKMKTWGGGNEKIGRLSKLVKVLEDESKTKDSRLENIFREASNYQNISKKLEAECQELKAHLESLKNTNMKLDQALNDKQKEFDAIAKKLEHLEHVEKEIKIYK